jgi:hypothetical protein
MKLGKKKMKANTSITGPYDRLDENKKAVTVLK